MANVIQLHPDRITITLSVEATRLIQAQIAEQVETEERHARAYDAEIDELNREIDEWNRSREESQRKSRELGAKFTPCEVAKHQPHYQKKPPQTPEQVAEYAIRMMYEPIEEYCQRTGTPPG